MYLIKFKVMKNPFFLFFLIVLACGQQKTSTERSSQDTILTVEVESVEIQKSDIEEPNISEEKVVKKPISIFQFQEIAEEQYANADGLLLAPLEETSENELESTQYTDEMDGGEYESTDQIIGTLPKSGLQVVKFMGSESEGFRLINLSTGVNYYIAAEYPGNPIESPDGNMIFQSYSDMGGVTGIMAIRMSNGNWKEEFNWGDFENPIRINLIEIKWDSDSLFYFRSGKIYNLPVRFYKITKTIQYE